MSYQVFARKYRPQSFADVIGQEHVVQTLRNAISQDRLAHAYLFVGPRGTGKTSLARIFAKALNCSDGPQIDFDPQEDICLEIAEGRSLDVLEIDGASNNGVEQVRELRETVKFAPARGQFKIYYIDEVHMLSTAAFNALLKTLEEPPPHVKFLFATTEAHKILPTILSRCQRFDLRPIPTRLIAEHLATIARTENLTIAEDALWSIARGADGGMRDAQSMLDQLVAFCGSTITEENVHHIFGFTARETVRQLVDHLLAQNAVGAIEILHTQAEAGKDLSRLWQDLIEHFRHVLVTQIDPQGGETPENLREILRGHASLISRERLVALLDYLLEAENSLKWAPNKALHVEIGLIRAVEKLRETDLSDIIRALRSAAEQAPVPTTTEKPHSSTAPQSSSPPPAVEAAAPTPPPKASAPLQTTPAPAKAPATSPSVTTPASSPEAIWAQLQEAVCQNRPLISTWVASGTALEQKGDRLVVGFPPEAAMAMESLSRPNNILFLEGLLQQIPGEATRLQLIEREGLPLPELAIADEEEEELIPPAAAPPSPEPAPATSASTDDPLAEFRNDPLIVEALQIFEAELTTQSN